MNNRPLPESFLKFAVLSGAFVFATAELLSVARALAPNPVRALWAAFALCLVWCLRRPRSPGLHFTASLAAAPLVLVLSLTLVVALASPPNNWDSMTYHMARTSHWIANESVAHYPSNMPAQLMMPPYAEYAITHLRLLAGGADRLVNLVQWLAFITCMAAAWVTAQRLTDDSTLAWLAAVVVASTPMNILQATSTQNDLTCAAWVAAFVAFTICAAQGDAGAPLWAGLSLGLALATKNTAASFALPFFIYGAGALLRRRDYRLAVNYVAACTLIAGAIAVPYMIRNWRTFGNPLGDPELADSLRITEPSPSGTVSNAVRMWAVQFATPWAPVNRSIADAVSAGHRLFGLDVDDPRFTHTRWTMPGLTAHEDETPNLILTLILMAAYPFLLTRRGPLRGYVVYSLAGCLLLCSLVKWLPWNSRYIVILFVLSAVPAAAILRRRPYFSAGILTLCAVPWLLFNTSRPLLPNGRLPSVLAANRTDLYFANRWADRSAFFELAGRVRGLPCRTVGMRSGLDTWEYSLWVLAPGFRFRHVDVKNASSRLSEPDVGAPCAVVADAAMTQTGDRVIADRQPFKLLAP